MKKEDIFKSIPILFPQQVRVLPLYEIEITDQPGVGLIESDVLILLL